MSGDIRVYPQTRDSGFHWMGHVPEHWSVLPNRTLFREIKIRGFPDADLLSVTIERGVIRQRDLLVNNVIKDSSNEDKSKYKLVSTGDMAYNKMRAWQGAIGLSRYRGIVSPAYIVLRLRDKHLPEFFHYLFRTPSFATEAQRWSYGISSDQWSLRWEDFKKIYCAVPPSDEQTAIVRFLMHEDRRIAQLIAAFRRLVGVSKSVTERKLSLINEYRTRLVVDVVTGKLDVREAASRLSDEGEHLDSPDNGNNADAIVADDFDPAIEEVVA